MVTEIKFNEPKILILCTAVQVARCKAASRLFALDLISSDLRPKSHLERFTHDNYRQNLQYRERFPESVRNLRKMIVKGLM